MPSRYLGYLEPSLSGSREKLLLLQQTTCVVAWAVFTFFVWRFLCITFVRKLIIREVCSVLPFLTSGWFSTFKVTLTSEASMWFFNLGKRIWMFVITDSLNFRRQTGNFWRVQLKSSGESIYFLSIFSFLSFLWPKSKCHFCSRHHERTVCVTSNALSSLLTVIIGSDLHHCAWYRELTWSGSRVKSTWSWDRQLKVSSISSCEHQLWTGLEKMSF